MQILKNRFIGILCLVWMFSFTYGQESINVTNVSVNGGFNNCYPGQDKPEVILTFLPESTGSIVKEENGVNILGIIDPCGFTVMKVNINNIYWDQANAVWLHGLFFPEDNDIVQIHDIIVPPGWDYFPEGSHGSDCSPFAIQGGEGFYFDGTAQHDCETCAGATPMDGIPDNNDGDNTLNCNTPFNLEFKITFCNSMIPPDGEDFTFTIAGKGDGNTGCGFKHDGRDSYISFVMKTVVGDIPLYETVPYVETRTTCLSPTEFRYRAIFRGSCGQYPDQDPREVMWFLDDDVDSDAEPYRIGNFSVNNLEECPVGLTYYAQCCPPGQACSRVKVTVTECPDPEEPPEFDPLDPFCQNVPITLPQPSNGIQGTWNGEEIDSSEPGTQTFEFTANSNCSYPVELDFVILPETEPLFEGLQLVYCKGDTPQQLPLLSDNLIPGTWDQLVINTNIVGDTEYTFIPEALNEGPICPITKTIKITVVEKLVLEPDLETQIICEDIFTGEFIADLTDLNELLFPVGNGVNFLYYESYEDLINDNPIPGSMADSYVFDQLPASIYVTGNVIGGDCISDPVQVNFDSNLIANHNEGPFSIQYCVDLNSEEDTIINLTQMNGQISFGEVDVKYYESFNDARLEINEIEDPGNFVPTGNIQVIYARVNQDNRCPFITELTLKRNPNPSLLLPVREVFICSGEKMEITVTSNDPNAVFQWTLEDGTVWYGPTQYLGDEGEYTIKAISQAGCESEIRELTVIRPSDPFIIGIEMGVDYAIINAHNNGEGELEYSLDGVTWQTSNVFQNLEKGGTYTVWVRSLGCTMSKYTFTMFFIANVLTPNGDGINDTWAVRGVVSPSKSTIKIFDRYGKIFVDTLFENNYEWDGRYNGRNVSTGDYWYVIDIPGTTDGKVKRQRLTGHITVKNH